ncbi:DUF6328 family protein [Ruania halotolerans]|uniref:DUF6328 family protein n=1 Tax=Ruania halotolerans TaxID=2897773 RepID=UPI001E4533A7|nr:DUF6328 family protein [Ruania halotolerans]UFU08052.1 DUF6328 family protein [Ruania halotolerans]
MTPRDAQDGSAGRNESAVERADRNWDELMQELRVTQTGAQILTGFLLTLPFQQRFGDLRSDQVAVYLILVGLALATTAFMVAPVSIHRMLFQKRRKPQTVQLGNRMAKVGLALLALTVTGIAWFIFDVVAGRPAAIAAAAGAAAVAAVFWLALPWWMRRGARGQQD